MRVLLEDLSRQVREVQDKVRLLRGEGLGLLAARMEETAQSILYRLSEMQCWIEVLRPEVETEAVDPIPVISPEVEAGGEA